MSPEQIKELKEVTEEICRLVRKHISEKRKNAVDVSLRLTDYFHDANKNTEMDDDSAWEFREIYTTKISWVLVDQGLIDWILKMCKEYQIKQLLEIGSGHGFLGGLLQNSEHDFDIKLTDPFLSHSTEQENAFTNVEKITSKRAINKYCYDDVENMVLMSVWPSQENDNAGLALEKFRKRGGKYFIYIGQNKYHSTGTDMFHEELENNWEKVEIYDNQQWNIAKKLFDTNDYSRFYTLRD
jgi:hypothetical protein